MNRDNMDNMGIINPQNQNYRSPVGIDVELVNSLTDGVLSIHEEIGYLKQHLLNNQGSGNPFAAKEVKVGTVSLSPEDAKKLKVMSDSIVMLYSEVKDLKKQTSNSLSETVERVGSLNRQQFVDMTKEVFTMEKIVENMKGEITDKIFESIEKKFDDEFFGSNSMVTKVVTNIVESIEKKIEMKFSEVFITLNNVQNQMNDNVREISSKLNKEFGEFKESVQVSLTDLQNTSYSNYKEFGEFKETMQVSLTELHNTSYSNYNDVQCNLNEQFAEVKSYVNNSYSETKNQIETKTGLDNEFMSKMQIEMRALNNKADTLLETTFATTQYVQNEIENQDDLHIVPYTNSDLERKFETIGEDIASKFDDKFDLIHGEITVLQNNVEREIPKLIKETIASTLVNNDDEHIKGLLEKISNQVGLDILEKSNEIEAINNEISTLKNQMKEDDIEIGNIDEDMSQSFSSLRGELDSLSKLIVESEDDNNNNFVDSMPRSISNISEELENLSKNMFDEE